MNKILPKSIVIIFLLFSNSLSYAQFKSKINILINDVHYENGMLKVGYTINNSKGNDRIRVWIDVFDSKKDTIKARSWKGDINKVLTGKENKLAIWDIYKDGLDLVDSVTLKISATVENRFYLNDPLIASTIYPGLGDYQIKPKKPYWIFGAIGYSFVGAAIGFNLSAKDNYNNYLEANSIAEKDNYFDKARLNKNLSYAFIGLAGLTWTVDYLGLLKRKKEIKELWKKNIPYQETPNIPGFKIVSAESDRILINTRLTNLQIADGTIKYIDLDENSCLDAFEEGKVQFKIQNYGPAKAFNFYAKIKCDSRNVTVTFPDSFPIGNLAVNQHKLIQIPIKALKNIPNGNLKIRVEISATLNNSVMPVELTIPTCSFKYQESITENIVPSDIDMDIPMIPDDGKERFALIIGNEGYANEMTGLSQHFNVPYARNDAIAFKKYAINILGVKEQNIILLLDAKKREMYENILVLSDRVKQLKNRAELIFYYAGHGLSDTSTTAPFLMPVDIAPQNINNGVSLDSLYKKITESKSVRSTVFLDASFNNGGRMMGLRGPSAKKIQYRPEVIPSNTVVFSAVWKNSDLYIYQDKNHGLFTYAVLKALKSSKGRISYLDLDLAINNEMLSYVKSPNDNRATTTFFSKDISDIWPNWMIR